MSNIPQNKISDKPSPVPARKVKKSIILTIIGTGVTLLFLFFNFRSELFKTPEMEVPTTEPPVKELVATAFDSAMLNLIKGRWVRPDGGYVLDIMSAGPDGKLNVGYFNPKSINVARSEWAQQEGKLYVMVELRDINYPGSMYGLLYIPEQDRLQGNYFQAQENATFQVEFVRE